MHYSRLGTEEMMDNHPEIVSLSNQLAQAVEAALNPEIPQEKRHEAYIACEEFKEKSPLSIPCSVYLALHGSHLLRHYGLQLLEYCVRYKWYDIDQPQKVSIKEATMALLRSTEGDFTEHMHLRDALSRVTVEMMKREWPQQWATLLPELYQIASEGCNQAEVVLLILLRFVEDIVIFQTLEYAQRRRDLYQHLTLQLEEIFTFLYNLMAKNYTLNVPESIRIVNLSLKLLSEIVEFAFVNRIAAEETRMVPVLCSLLSNENYQLETAECLLRIASKKGKLEDKRIVCKLLLNSSLIMDLSRLNFMLQNDALNEENYRFIKKVAELLSSTCTLLCTVVKNDSDNLYECVKVDVFVILLEMLVNLCKHPSLVVAHHANVSWTCIFKHNVISKDTNIANYIPKWVAVVAPKLIKIPYNPKIVIPIFRESYNYLTFDFESVDEFNTFCFRFRVELHEAFRHLTGIAPLVVFSCVEEWLRSLMQKYVPLQSSMCSPESLEYLEWEAVGGILETVIANLPAMHAISLDRAVYLFDLCLKMEPADPNIASFLLSCVSSLTYFVHNASSDVTNVYVPRLLQRVLTCLIFQLPSDDPHARSKETKALRKHAACLLIKLSRKYRALFVPFFDSIHKAFIDLKREPDRLSKLELIIFLESVLQISSGFGNYDTQSAFIKQVFAEVNEYWQKQTEDVLSDHNKFAAFIGLNAKPSEYAASYKNRTDLLYCVDLIAAIIKRSTWPDSPEAALSGGFVVSVGENTTVYRNPATPHILPALPGIFFLIKAMHSLWTDEAKRKLPPGYENVHAMAEHELKTLFGGYGHHEEQVVDEVYEISEGSENIHKMQHFLINLYELCFAVLSKACHQLGNSFYQYPNFAFSFGGCIFCHLDAVPDYRLRTMIKTFFRLFVYYCPSDKHDIILVPILSFFTTYMLGRFSNKWKYLNVCRANGKYDENESEEDNKELIEHCLNAQLCREYMDMVKSMLMKTNSADTKQLNGTGKPNEELSSPSGSQSNLNLATTNAYDSLSDLGVKLLRNETARGGIVHYLLNSISWADSTNSLKACIIMPVIVKQLMADRLMTAELAVQILTSLLQGLQEHGQHDANLGSLLNSSVQVYQTLRPVYPQVLELMSTVSNITINDLQKFDVKVMNVAMSHKVEKGLRDQFRKLVNNIIGRNVGQMFKRKEAIRDLPKIDIPRPKGESLLNLSGNENDIGIANFFK